MKYLLTLFVLLTPTALFAQPTAEALLDASIAYHDPQGRFLSEPHLLIFRDDRPDHPPRAAEVLIDVPGERFTMVRKDEHEIRTELAPGHCVITLDGSTEISEEVRKERRLTCERMQFMRNYYTYLWGLPMKLRDPGTHLGEPFEDTFDGREVYALKATYAEDVGTDVWYFYFDRETSALTGYRFYRDETESKGEYIYLEGEVEAHGMKLPKNRAWYIFEDDRFLGTDHLLDIR